MKLFVEKLPLSTDDSFIARTHTTPLFEVPWHQHVEYELILITQGSGLSFIGNFIGDFEPGDIFFLGSNLPHTFQKNRDVITSAMIVQFRDDFWGNDFLALPESKSIRKLLVNSCRGYKVNGKTGEALRSKIEMLETAKGFKRIITLCECLDILARSKSLAALSTQEVKPLNDKNRERIDVIFKYTMDRFKEPIQLSTVAKMANMSVPAFCNYFKRTTRKKYIDFVNEIRIGYSCQLLNETEESIINVCYESGFNTVANFNRQFLRLKGMTPSRFRKAFSGTSREQEFSLSNREVVERTTKSRRHP
jgi:AraC-like DNA-binding protein